MIFFYNFFLQAAWLFIKVLSPFNTKAQLWINGRNNWRQNLKNTLPNQHRIVWIHCASLGEFEQGRPIIERIKRDFPQYDLLLTFFSPSGYEIRKDYPFADYIMYLPLDTRKNANDFIDMVQPQLVIFVKYEFWYHFLSTIAKNNIPLVLVAALFRPHQLFFKWYGGIFRRIPFFFQNIFVQNKASLLLLEHIGYTKAVVVGDTRIDRVAKIAEEAEPEPQILDFNRNRKVLIAGSTWPPEEKILLRWLQKVNLTDWCLIMAPHDVSRSNIKRLEKLFSNVSLVKYTQYHKKGNASILLVDTIGKLSSLYQVGNIALIGGGFGKSIHNILEPAAFGIPILFGPNHKKFVEARALLSSKGAFEVNNFQTFLEVFDYLCEQQNYEDAQKSVQSYIDNGKGATDRLIKYISTNL